MYEWHIPFNQKTRICFLSRKKGYLFRILALLHSWMGWVNEWGSLFLTALLCDYMPLFIHSIQRWKNPHSFSFGYFRERAFLSKKKVSSVRVKITLCRNYLQHAYSFGGEKKIPDWNEWMDFRLHCAMFVERGGGNKKRTRKVKMPFGIVFVSESNVHLEQGWWCYWYFMSHMEPIKITPR